MKKLTSFVGLFLALCWASSGEAQFFKGKDVMMRRPPQPGLSPAKASQMVSDIQKLTAGAYHTCVLLDGRTVKCWGDNSRGQLGDGTTTPQPSPKLVPGLSNVKDVAAAAGGSHTCALFVDGSVKCWGANNDGQLGDGTTADKLGPTPVQGLDGLKVRELALGAAHTCALLDDGIVKCWGFNSAGQLGRPTGYSSDFVLDPQTSTPLRGVLSVIAGHYHTCARMEDHSLRCWGLDTEGQLGDGKKENRWQAKPVEGVGGVIAAVAGVNHTCAFLHGSVLCWGDNYYGQVGDGTMEDRLTPIVVPTMGDVVSLAAGRNHTCALLSHNEVRCWGENQFGQRGNGTTTLTMSPTPVSGLIGVKGLAAGNKHTCALLEGGTVQCWGNNFDGQLGNGSSGVTDPQLTPTFVKF